MHARGFSLIELLVALAIAALLAAFAVPAVSGAFESTRARGAEAALVGSLARAASGASLSGTRAVLCPSRAGAAGCIDGVDWSEGWLVFQDLDQDRERDAGEAEIARQDALGGQVRLRTTSGRPRIVFQGYGSNAGSNATFTVCDGRGAQYGRSLVLNNRGQLRTTFATPEALAQTCPQ
jgi:type IV fimbrial biogenesis protein FimT